MLEKLYKKSEVWFAVIFIIAYVVGDSFLIQASEGAGIEMVYTIPYNLLLLGIMFAFIGKNHLLGYYGINKVKCKASKLLYYVPLVIIATVNIWFGVSFKMGLIATVVYFAAMIITGIVLVCINLLPLCFLMIFGSVPSEAMDIFRYVSCVTGIVIFICQIIIVIRIKKLRSTTFELLNCNQLFSTRLFKDSESFKSKSKSILDCGIAGLFFSCLEIVFILGFICMTFI